MHYVGHRRPHAAHLRSLPVRVPEGRCSRSTSSSPMSAFVLGASQILFFVNFFWSAFKGKKAGENPWNANGLEWTTPSPPPHGNWPGEIPEVYRWPYDYSVPGRPDGPRHADRPVAHRRAGGEALSARRWPTPVLDEARATAAPAAAAGHPPTPGPATAGRRPRRLLGDPARFGLLAFLGTVSDAVHRLHQRLHPAPRLGRLAAPRGAARPLAQHASCAEQRDPRGARGAGLRGWDLAGAQALAGRDRPSSASLFVAGQFAGLAARSRPQGVFLARTPTARSSTC